MKYIDTEGKGHTLLILTDAESRCIRTLLQRRVERAEQEEPSREADHARSALRDFNRGIQRGTDKMAEESKAEWKARKK